VLEKRFGRRLREQAIDGTVAQSYEEALKSEGLFAITEPDIQDTKFEEDASLKYRAVIEIPPRVVELSEYKGLMLERHVAEVRDADIEQVLENTRQAHAVYVPRDAKPATDGDLLVIDYGGTIDGAPFQGSTGESVTVILGERGYFHEFSDALRGLVPESETEVKVKFPEDHDRADLAGKEALFHVKVKEVKERVLPALDAEFAKEAGDCDTLEEFRNRVRLQLDERQQDRVESNLRWQALSTIVNASSFELPKTAIEHVAEDVYKDKVRMLSAAGVPPADIDEREEELWKECRADAELELKIASVELEIAKREGLIVTDEEIEQEKADLRESGVKAETVENYFNVPDLRERYRMRMLRRKARRLILEAARIRDVRGGTEESSESRSSESSGEAETAS
jgi:trigger factor